MNGRDRRTSSVSGLVIRIRHDVHKVSGGPAPSILLREQELHAEPVVDPRAEQGEEQHQPLGAARRPSGSVAGTTKLAQPDAAPSSKLIAPHIL
jgi:hypothetical protein